MVEQVEKKNGISQNETASGKRLKMSSPLSIRLIPSLGRKYRRGELQYLRRALENGNVTTTPMKGTMPTPGLLIYTRKLGVPHITYDNLESLPMTSSFLHLNTENCILDLPHSFPGDLATFLKPMSKYLKLWSSYDPIKADADLLKHGQAFVQIKTDMGRQKLSAEQYMNIALKWKPDCITSLSPPPPTEEQSKSQSRKVFDRWQRMFDDCLAQNSFKAFYISMSFTTILESTIQDSGIPFFATLTSLTTEYLIRAVDKIVQHSDEIHGVVFNTNVPEVLDMAKTLPTVLPRISIGIMTPEEILTNLEHIDLFPSSICHLLADSGYVMNLNLDRLECNVYMDLRDEQFRAETRSLSLDNPCPCWACANHNAAYVFHLLDSHEMLGLTLISMHNLVQLDQFLNSIRKSIDSDTAREKIDRFLIYFNENLKTRQNLLLQRCMQTSNKLKPELAREE